MWSADVKALLSFKKCIFQPKFEKKVDYIQRCIDVVTYQEQKRSININYHRKSFQMAVISWKK